MKKNGDNMENIVDEQIVKKALNKYCKEVNNYYKAGNIESSYNKPVIELIQSFGCQAHDYSGARSGVTGENIDIKLWHVDEDISKIPPFGAIEVKKVNGEDERAKEQIIVESKKYGNVILTDNVVWKFYRDDSEKMYNGFKLLKKNENNEFELDETKIELFIATIRDFILEKPTNIKSSNRLAYFMSEYAKTIKTVVYNILQADSSKAMHNELLGLYSRIKQELLPDLGIKEFSDMYAQTIVYGLFIARYNDKTTEDFTRGEAIANLSKESHLLKQFFQHIATSENLHPTLNDSIDSLCELYALANLKELLDQYEKKDAIVHFYEDFLTYYDIDQKKSFGAYYTPTAVVKYIVSMVDDILVKEFNIKNGLANNDTTTITVKCDPYTVGVGKKQKTYTEKEIDVPKVAILDPACGTGTFGAEIIKYIKEKYFSGSNEAFYKDWIENENGLMQRLISFEIMMTSYVIAHLKIRRTLMESLGDAQLDKRVPSNIFLTNTLAKPKSILERNDQISLFDFSGAITEEAENADQWKCRRPIQVIIGNPPYLAASKNEYDISAYKYETDGKTKLKEKNPKWLNDDYVKFIRFAEQHIQNDGKGILAFITNNGYLDNPTFRGMRASLLRTFDTIYILNLHGNSIKKETSPDGSKDENVFDIRVGVAIIIAIKKQNNEEWAKIKYADLYGTRNDKFKFLENDDILFRDVIPDEKMAMYIPQEEQHLKNEYDKGISLVELFNMYSAGIVTGRDKLCIQKSKKDIDTIIREFEFYTIEALREKYNLGKDTRDWTVKGAQREVAESSGKVSKIAYRIFDDRWTYYSGRSKGFHCMPRGEVMKSFSVPNIALCFTRTDKSSRKYAMIFVTNKITESCFLTTQTAGICTIAPLYTVDSNHNKQVNINKEFYDQLIANLDYRPSELEVFDYCYGILFDNDYRSKYNSFLKQDYPRVPIIENKETFEKYVDIGTKLRKLHLMEYNVQKELQIESSNNNLLIETSKYEDGSVRINSDTVISGITEEEYNYYLGGYQIIEKWLKSHKGEILTIESFEHIKRIVGIVDETIKIQKNNRN